MSDEIPSVNDTLAKHELPGILVPLFQSEIAPPATRGFLVSQHGMVDSSFLYQGFGCTNFNHWCRSCSWLFAGCLDRICFLLLNQSLISWPFPFCVQCLWPLVMLMLTSFLRESPRWCKFSISPTQ